MSKEQLIEELGRRAKACKGWRWMPGMLLLGRMHPNRVVIVEDDWLSLDDLMGSGLGVHPKEAIPDLDDPATLGCIEHALLPELPVAPIDLRFDGEKWLCLDSEGRRVTRLDGRSFWSDRHPRSSRFDTKGEALVAALEAAP